MTYKELHKIESADDGFIEDGLRLRVVKLFWDENDHTCLTVMQLKKILELWILGEEEKYPQCKGLSGRGMIKAEIDKVFRDTPVDKLFLEKGK